MSKIVLDNVESGYNLQKINSNFQKIEDELNNKVLYRDNPAGEPNTVASDVDMNSKSLLNVGSLSVIDEISIAGTDITLAFGEAATASIAAVAAAEDAAMSETNAAASASAALISENNAETAATSAASSATSASSSATSASTSAISASASATSATASASTATTQASNASASASSALASKVAAEAASDAALAALDSFDDRYLGQKASDPSLDNDGNPLVAGALYFNTTDDIMKVYEGSTWVAAYASLSGAMIAANNLSDLVNFATARANLGVAVGTDVQAYDADLTDLATYGAGTGNNQYVKRDSTGKIPINGSWTVYESAGVLYFAVSGVAKAKLDSSGNLTVIGNVTAYGTM